MSEGSEKMSDHSENSSDYGNNIGICRDFLRNVCRRGNRCKFRHPGESEADEFKRFSEYTFCHDYQNNGCPRPNCKFLHCTKDEEEIVRQTGELPARVLQAAAVGIGVNPTEIIAKGGIPICKDNLKGDCHRGNNCKYRHMSSVEYEFLQRKSEGYDSAHTKDLRSDRLDLETDLKRRRIEPEFISDRFRTYESCYTPLLPNSRPLSYQLLEEENQMLRKKVGELKKQVSDLTATNEVLLEQNARYRVSKTSMLHNFGSAGVQAVLQATTLNPLNANLAQQIALSNELSTLSQQQQVLQQQIVRELTAGVQVTQCSIAGPQMLNTAALPMNPPTVVPVSLPQTLAGLQPSNNQQSSLSQNIGMSTASLVSYPVVSQRLRMTASSLTL